MKIKGEQFKDLEFGLMGTLKAYDLHPYMVKNTAQAWEVFHRAWRDGRIDGQALYKIANDSTIETALNKIFKKSS